jgi:4a-hydroxytetrahydrobiopterin dehydratase
MSRELLSPAEIESRASSLASGWSVSSQALTRTVEFPTFLAAVDFVSRMAPHAEELNHHPDVLLSWRRVDLTLSTHSSGGVTALDFELALALDPVIADLVAT